MSETPQKYVKVVMLVGTRAKGYGRLNPGHVLELGEAEAERWIHNRVARPADADEAVTPRAVRPTAGRLSREEALAVVQAERQRDSRNSPGLRVQSKALRDQAEAEQRLQLGEAAGVVNGPDPAAENDLTPTRRGPGRPRKE